MSAGYDSETASEEDPVVLTPQVKRKSQEIVVVESSDTESDEDLARVKRFKVPNTGASTKHDRQSDIEKAPSRLASKPTPPKSGVLETVSKPRISVDNAKAMGTVEAVATQSSRHEPPVRQPPTPKKPDEHPRRSKIFSISQKSNILTRDGPCHLMEVSNRYAQGGTGVKVYDGNWKWIGWISAGQEIECCNLIARRWSAEIDYLGEGRSQVIMREPEP